MQKISNNIFYDLAKRYDSDADCHLIGEVDFHLLCDDKPYEGLNSHREALRSVFEQLKKKDLEDQKKTRNRMSDCISDQLEPLAYDIGKAQPTPLDPQTFFYCPAIVSADRYGNVRYDTDWKPGEDHLGTAVPYWYALMEPVHGRKSSPEDFRKVNDVLFPNGTEMLEIYEWTTDWSDYFDDGHEWYGACCWSIYDESMERYVVLLVSATD